MLAVIKANAYGHGALVCAPMLVRAGARWLGVTSAAEGSRVRAALVAEGLAAEILLMCGFLAEDVTTILAQELTPVVWTREQLQWLRGTGLRVHIEVDTGMGRQGVPPGPGLDELMRLVAGAGLRLDGFYTHFCSSEVAGSELTQLQERRFEAAISQLQHAGLTPAWVHAGNTSTLDNPAQGWPWLAEQAATVGARAMVRSGLALYGYCLNIDGPAEARVQPCLQPVMMWRASVIGVRTLKAGETIGYNATFTAPAEMRVATLAVGYADGLRRELSGPKGWVMLGGERAPILGRISMNLTVVDVTHLSEVTAGDTAVVLGEGVSADDHARLAGTIAYEILCGIHPCG